jgi:outer membrane protein assembly factor BamD (BamD/ComL family)
VNTFRYLKYTLLLLPLLALLHGCSPESSGLVGHAYHNITAKYNAYFIAREKLDEVLLRLEEAHEHNFNKTLLVLSPIDTNIVKSDSAILADVIKKASIAIQRHKVSKWVDDSYILVGKTRMLNREYEESIETYKYVNVNSDDKQTRYKALINLIRTFVEYNEYNNAQAVIDFLLRKKLNKENKIDFYIQAANFAQVTGDPNNLIKYLTLATEIMPNGDNKARMHYILGQLFQKAGLDALAYENYEFTIDNNPPYEFFFHARLNMAQVTELSEGADVKKIRKYFEQLLKDGKNVEFKDKIYYEMAEFELKQNNLSKAINYYKSSVRESVNNQRQKSFAYHKLGIVYFEDLKKYTLAKAYYDSAAQTMPKDEEIYDKVYNRQQVLADFVKQINTIETNDSLISLAKMDTSALNQMFEKLRDERIAAEEEEAKRKRKEARNQGEGSQFNGFSGENTFTQNTNSSGKFYFYDASTVATGSAQFKRVWGDRSLQDNWRYESGRITQTDAEKLPPDDVTAVNNATEDTNNSELSAYEQDKQAFYASIPFKESKQQALLVEVEKALYTLGNIYNFDLKEKTDAIETYKTLLERFPQTEYKPEILYLLYVYYKGKEADKSEQYANELTSKYPETIFAKLVINPNYQEESNAASAKVKILYEKAYSAYDTLNFDSASFYVQKGLENYPENDYEDNMKLLEALIIGKTEDKNNYLFKLQEFVKEYPNSELVDFAKRLMTAIEDYKKKIQALGEIKYIPYFDQAHYFVVLYENNKALSGLLPEAIEGFAEKFYPDENLNAGNLVFNNEYSMILLSEFKDKKTAESFYLKFNSDLSPLNNFSSLSFDSFIISKDNFQIFYQAKVPDSYDQFFKDNYKLAP